MGTIIEDNTVTQMLALRYFTSQSMNWSEENELKLCGDMAASYAEREGYTVIRVWSDSRAGGYFAEYRRGQ